MEARRGNANHGHRRALDPDLHSQSGHIAAKALLPVVVAENNIGVLAGGFAVSHAEEAPDGRLTPRTEKYSSDTSLARASSWPPPAILTGQRFSEACAAHIPE